MNKQPKSFYVIASIALLWNLIGVFQYLGMAYMSAETFNSLDESMQSYIINEPAWVTAAFALAVFSASVASVGLCCVKLGRIPFLCSQLFALSHRTSIVSLFKKT